MAAQWAHEWQVHMLLGGIAMPCLLLRAELCAWQAGTQNLLRVVSCAFLAVVSVCAAVGFLVYGGRLFLMLRR